MKHGYTTLLYALAVSLFITSCLTGTDQDEAQSQFAVDLQLENVSSTQVSGGDTLQVTGVSFLQGPVALETSSEDSTLLFPGVGVFIYRFPSTAYQRLLAGELDGGTYSRMTYDIVQAQSDDENIPGNFVDGEGEDQRYSMIITGTYNNSEFEFKSTQPFSYEFDLSSPVEVPETNTSLTLAVNFNVDRVFLNTGGEGLLDPSDPENSAQINENIQLAIELLPFAE